MIGCGKGDSAPKPCVFLITVDTLRQDNLSCYGYSRETSPNIDRLAKDSIRFTETACTRTSTSPSLASTMTGLYPFKHGVATNFTPLHDSLTTLPEMLKQEGYSTSAFISNYVLIRDLSHMEQGFDHYDDFVNHREPNRAIYERKGEDTVNAALSWLKDRPTGPLFVWLHLMDPHGPYLPPSPFDEKFRTGRSLNLEADKIPPYQRLDSTDASYYIDRYDGEIAYCDQQIGRFLDGLKANGLYDDSLILFHADHGESLGEHGWWFRHGQDVYEEESKVPLLIKPNPSIHDRLGPFLGQAVSHIPVSMVDILPTIFEAIGSTPPANLDGQGVLKALEQEKREDPFILIDQSGVPRDVTHIALRGVDGKLICRIARNRDMEVISWEFYRIASDPKESKNIFSREDPVQAPYVEKMEQWLEEIRNYKLPFVPERFAPKDGDAFVKDRLSLHKKQLELLGYTE